MPSLELDEPPSRISPVRAIVLAAGKGTRMRSRVPKVLHPLRGIPLIEHSLRTALAATRARPVIVVGHDADAVRAAVGTRADFVVQSEQLGTGHAVMQAEAALRDDPATDLIVTAADMPLVRAETLAALAERRASTGAAISMLTVVVDEPRGFGRVTRDAAGNVTAIVEAVACTPEQLAIRELNGAIYCIDAAWLWGALRRIRPNPKKGEYFLTDLVEIAVADGRTVQALVAEDIDECIGINTRVDLADADAALRRRINRAHMLNGVSIVDPATTYIDLDVAIGADTTVLPNTHLLGDTRIGTDCVIGPNALLRNATIGAGCEIRQSVIEESQVDDGADVGPWSHLRGGTHIGAGAHVGNFGEIKKSTLGARSKMGHFSYLGDATVGEDVNIGAGAITCNYDGARKNPTTIGDGAFIGSDTMLVAPVEVGANATTGAGAVVTKNVPPDTVAVGLPARVIRRKSNVKTQTSQGSQE
jgi:bifunctional UDP-N-acetylglucosamine pyrophosphorylase / glucosamine-1-phosphate N-acetyltransferase